MSACVRTGAVSLTGAVEDQAGIQFHILNRSKGAAVWVRRFLLYVDVCLNERPGPEGTNRP